MLNDPSYCRPTYADKSGERLSLLIGMRKNDL